MLLRITSRPPLRAAASVLFTAALVLAAAPAAGVGVDPPRSVYDATVPWRWIGLKSDPTKGCPVAGSPLWGSRPLFELPVQPWTSISPRLRDFCLYELTVPGAVPAFPPIAGLRSFEPDPLAVRPAGEPTETPAWEVLRDHFLRQAGEMDLPLLAGSGVRLAVLDTAATDRIDPERTPGRSPHGHTLVNMAKRLVCSTPSRCNAEVVTRLALAYLGFDRHYFDPHDRDEVNGGYVGTLGDLAEAIVEEVRAAQADGRRLVINLSVGWDAIHGGANPLASPALAAVYFAVEEATAAGALVIAASGNESDEVEGQTGPLYPAGWEVIPDLSGSCQGSNYSPLLYAVSGVRSDGQPLTNALAASAAPLAAYGDHAVVELYREDEPTAVLTGSSVAALVASATAAVVWSYRPTLSRCQVMALLRSSGDDLARPADFCKGKPRCDTPMPVRRLSLCKAVRQACLNGDGACPQAAPTCPSWSSDPPPLTPLSLDFTPTLAPVDATELDVPYGPEEACGEPTPLYRPGSQPLDPCPARQYYGALSEPWVNPQPRSDPCPNCSIFLSSGTLLITIDPDFVGTLTEPIVTVCAGKSTATSYALDLGPLTAGDQVEVKNLAVDPGCEAATVSFTVNGEASATSAVLVVE